jgi:hypothetical protein
VVLSDFVAPAVTSAAVSGGTSLVVARLTARSAIGAAEIGAAVERERLAHSRQAWQASRRDRALADVLKLDEQMEVVANVEIVAEVRNEAAAKAHRALVAVALTLQDDATANTRINELREALRSRDLERAAGLWRHLRSRVLEGRLA